MERKGLLGRAAAQAVLALALVHHLAIAKNIPLSHVVDWLVELAPCGVVEFVPKADPMVQEPLRSRTDIFDDYSEESFVAKLASRAEIVEIETTIKTGRKLIWFRCR